jgi:predicted TPR repeat methyltransferase
MRDLKQTFDQAIKDHIAGNLDSAEQHYNAILECDPGHLDAMHMLGMVAFQRGHYEIAIKMLLQVLRKCPSSAAVLTNLGNIYVVNEQPDEAINVLKKAISIDPFASIAYNNLGNAYRLKGHCNQAISAYMRAIDLNHDFTDALANLGGVYYSEGKYDEAISYFDKTFKLNPEHPSAGHILASLRGQTTERAPIGHIRQLFDDYSSRFDDHLVRELGYAMPRLIREEIDLTLGPGAHFEHTIDIGCGTGLAGIELRNRSKKLTGLDVSLRMIEKAKARNIYDHLHVGDIFEYFKSCNEIFDLVICADVLPYIGNIHTLFESIGGRMGVGACLAISTEATSEADYFLRDTARYAHSREYIEKVANDTGYTVISMKRENLRKHKGEWLLGDLVLLMKQ